METDEGREKKEYRRGERGANREKRRGARREDNRE